MATPVNLNDLLDAFEWVSADGSFKHGAYVHRETGKVYWVTEEGALGEDEIPEDVEDEDLYVPVPHKRDLDLGKWLALRFVEEHAPASLDRARLYFSKPGAYARFKHLLEELGKLENWYTYEQEAVERALREWAEGCDMQVSGSGGDEG